MNYISKKGRETREYIISYWDDGNIEGEPYNIGGRRKFKSLEIVEIEIFDKLRGLENYIKSIAKRC